MFLRYNPTTGQGAIGVEFAGTAVTSTSSFGTGISPVDADKISTSLVAINTDLQGSEGSYRGFFTLTLDPHQANATYWAMRNVSEYHSFFFLFGQLAPCGRPSDQYSAQVSQTWMRSRARRLSSKQVCSSVHVSCILIRASTHARCPGANKLSRPVAGGSVKAGVLKVQGQT